MSLSCAGRGELTKDTQTMWPHIAGTCRQDRVCHLLGSSQEREFVSAQC